MENYTEEDVINALSKIKKNSRERALVDQRSYLIGLLKYRFMMPEHSIANVTGYKRSTVHHNKTIAVQFCKDKSYVQNVYVYAQMFPFDFSVVDTVRTKRKVKVKLDILHSTYTKLKTIGSILGHDDIRVTINFLLEKNIKLWEE
jgi:hypothetical protein